MDLNQLTERVIGAAINVHRALGSGLLESAYEMCLCHELDLLHINHQRQHPLPLTYKGKTLDCSYRIDVLVEQTLVLELKTVETIQPIHEAQLLTYLRLGKFPIGLILNFHTPVLTQGIKRMRL